MNICIFELWLGDGYGLIIIFLSQWNAVLSFIFSLKINIWNSRKLTQIEIFLLFQWLTIKLMESIHKRFKITWKKFRESQWVLWEQKMLISEKSINCYSSSNMFIDGRCWKLIKRKNYFSTSFASWEHESTFVMCKQTIFMQ